MKSEEDFLLSASDPDYWKSADHGKRDALRRALEEQKGITITPQEMNAKTSLDLLKLQAQLQSPASDEEDATDPAQAEAQTDADSSFEQANDSETTESLIEEERQEEYEQKESATESNSDAG